MNKSYMYANGNIHIFTDNEKRVIDYNDNFEKQLVSENKLEIVENLIMKNEEQIENLKIKIYDELKLDIAMTSAYSMMGYCLPLFIDYFCKLNLENINNFSIGLALIFLIFGIVKSIKQFNDMKFDILEYKARKESREKFVHKYLEERINYEVLSLSNDKEIEEKYKKQKFEIKELDSQKTNKNINDYFALILTYKAYKKDFHREYKKGIFFKKNSELFDSEALNIIENMIKEEIKVKKHVKSK